MKDLNNEKHLQEEIKKILLLDWDPIGVRSMSGATNEYDTYAEDVFRLLISTGTENDIFDYLYWVETEHMGLQGDKSLTKAIANKITKLI